MNTKRILLGAVVAATLAGCYSDYDDPNRRQPVEMTPTITIADLKALYAQHGGPFNFTENYVIGGKVTSSDRMGNFYKNMFIEDETAGIELRIGMPGLYNVYKVGQTVYVTTEGLRMGGYRGMVNIGGPVPANYDYETAYIEPQALVDYTIHPGKLGDPVEPTILTSAANIPQSEWGKWVRFENAVLVQNYYYDIDGTNGGGNIPLETWGNPGYEGASSVGKYGNAIFDVNGGRINVRTSGYAKFSGEKVPPIGSVCNIEGVLTYYSGGQPAYQITINSLEDIEVVKRAPQTQP